MAIIVKLQVKPKVERLITCLSKELTSVKTSMVVVMLLR